MKLIDFFQSCPEKSNLLLKEFTWILEERFSLSASDLISGLCVISDEHIKTLNDWREKKKADYPLQYFLNSTEFLGREFHIEEGALIPRMETEDIVNWTIENSKRPIHHILDIGSGSGCMGISLALEMGAKTIDLVEPYEAACKSLRKNIFKFISSSDKDSIDLEANLIQEKFENLELLKFYDLIVSNPPYIKIGDPEVENSVFTHEPHEALYGGAEGWELAVHWVHKSYESLNADGALVFEMAYNQKTDLQEKLSKYKPEFFKDRFGKDRFFVIKKI